MYPHHGARHMIAEVARVLANAGLDFEFALVKGRGRYVSRAKLPALADDFTQPSLSLGM